MDKNSKIYVAGHNGMVGNALIRRLKSDGYTHIVTRSHKELDLTRQNEVESFFEAEKPECVFLLAARMGGIAENKEYPADFLYQNAMIEMNIINSAFRCGTKKLLFAGSACVYPELSAQPMKEEYILTGKYELHVEGYAIAKTVGIKLIEYLNRQFGTEFIAVSPANMYGTDGKSSTVLPMLINKFYDAIKTNTDKVEIWGTGNARREFLHADDFCDAMIFLAKNYNGAEHLNVGSGTDITIRALAELIKNVSGFSGELVFDSSKPEGAARKLLDSAKINALGWFPKISLEEGVRSVYEYYCQRYQA